jgi:hypothetical protein
MSSGALKGVGEAVWGLLVEDGSLAIGIVAALLATWLAATFLADQVRGEVGWLLLAMLTLLVVSNLRAAGQRARRETAANG